MLDANAGKRQRVLLRTCSSDSLAPSCPGYSHPHTICSFAYPLNSFRSTCCQSSDLALFLRGSRRNAAPCSTFRERRKNSLRGRASTFHFAVGGERTRRQRSNQHLPLPFFAYRRKFHAKTCFGSAASSHTRVPLAKCAYFCVCTARIMS